jgi:hypothetical protein
MPASVPNTNSFGSQDVADVVGGTSLQEFINNAVPAYFDTEFKGIKTGTLNDLYSFRNYQIPTFSCPVYIYNNSANASISEVKVFSVTPSGVTFPVAGLTTGFGNSAMTGAQASGTITVTVTTSIPGHSIRITDGLYKPQCTVVGKGTFTVSFTGVTIVSGYSLTIDVVEGPCPTYNLPTVTTFAVSNIVYGGATSGGNVSSDGGQPVTSRGICWIKWYAPMAYAVPTVADAHTVNSSGIGSFTSVMTGLEPNSRYYVRAYATNSVGTNYGAIVEFNSVAMVPGTAHEGGVVAYVFQPEDAGYVAGQVHGILAYSDWIAYEPWAKIPGAYGVTGATGQDIGTGAANTLAIYNFSVALGYSTPKLAGHAMYVMNYLGYTDWVFPSLTEMVEIQANRGVIPGLASTYYWTSTEYNANEAYLVQMSTGYRVIANKTIDGSMSWGGALTAILPIRYF